MYTLTTEDIDRLGAKATLVQNIVKVKVLKRSEVDKLEDKDRQVVVIYTNGSKKNITIEELVGNYTHASGNRVKSMYIKRGQVYLMKEMIGADCKVVKIPSGKSVELNGKVYDSTKTIVYVNGNITIVPSKFFKKMFILREKPVARRKSLKPVKSVAVTPVKNEVTKVQEVDTKGLSSKDKLVAAESVKDAEVANRNTGNRVTAAIVDAKGRVLGYIVTDREGKQHKVKYGNVMMMARKGNIDNVVVADMANGKSYLRGFGIRLDNLPTVLL